MNAFPLIAGAAAVFALAYRYYYGFIVAKALTLDDSRQTPARGLYDGKAKYAAITVVPMVFVGVTTMTAAVENILNMYIPQMLQAPTRFQGIINVLLTALILVCLVVVLVDAVPRWFRKESRRQPVSVETAGLIS